MTRDLDTRDEIAAFVTSFYREVAQDHRLHRWFGTIAHVDWHAHTGDLTDYWVGVLFDEPHDCAGDVIEGHRWLHAADPFDRDLFDRWLDLFDSVLDSRWQGPMAELARRRARGLAWAMEKRLTGHAVRRAS